MPSLRSFAPVGAALLLAAGSAQASPWRLSETVVVSGPALRVQFRGPNYYVGPHAPQPRHRHGFWQRFEDSWGAPYWVWNDAPPVRVVPGPVWMAPGYGPPPVYGPPPAYVPPAVYGPPAVYVAPRPTYAIPAPRPLPPVFRHPERRFDGAASPHRPDPRFDPNGRR